MENDGHNAGWVSVENAACLFPRLNTTPSRDDSRKSVAVPIDLREVSEFCEENHITPLQLLQVTWGLALQSYAGNDRPWFAYEDSQPVSCADAPPDVRNYVSLDLSENKTCLDLVQETESWTTKGDRTDLLSRSNTAIIRQKTNCTAHQYDICIVADGNDFDVEVSLQYKQSIISDRQAAIIADVIAHILPQLAQKQVKASSIELCPPSVLDELTTLSGKTPTLFNQCIHDAILEQCAANPERPAISAWDGDFCYRDVEQLTTSLSHHLAAHGIGPESFVAIYFDKSKWTAIAMISILRAGGAFVLLDSSFPKARLAEMCSQLDVKMVICSSRLSQEATFVKVSTLILDHEIMTSLERQSSAPNAASIQEAKSHNAAFAVFTSGSTGIPKGIIFNHDSFCTGQREVIQTIGYGPGTRALQFTSYAFDVSVLEHLTPLMAGSCVCISPENALKSNLVEAMRLMRVNLAFMTPTVSRLMRPAEVRFLEKLVLLGEPLLDDDIETWAESTMLFNGYGPAECCVLTSLHLYSDVSIGPNIIGLGKGAICWVVDPSNRSRLLPPGAIGELLIEGPIVGRGYVKDERRSKSSFIEAPSWRSNLQGHKESASLMYCSGDLVQYVSDGLLRYIGRRDSQAKIHGQRLELEEVECCIRQGLPPGSQTFAVLASPAGAASTLLVGFILYPKYEAGSLRDVINHPTEGFKQLTHQIRKHLEGRLPRYMIPSVLLPLNDVPKTPTGKADRKHLSRLASQLTREEIDGFMRDKVYRSQPGTDDERLLHRMVAQVLQVSDFGMNENFYHLGGDSVSAMRLIRQAREEVGLVITMDNIYKNPMLSDMAVAMRSNQEDIDIEPLSLLTTSDQVSDIIQRAQKACGVSSRDEIEDIYPCTPLQEGIIALSVSSAEAKYTTVSTYRLPQAIDIDRFKHAWDEVILINPILRTRFIHNSAGQLLQVVLKAGIDWNLAQDLDDMKLQASRWRVEIGEPLLKLILLPSPRETRVCICISHAAYDGWSLPETLKQVEKAYYGGVIHSRPFKHFIRHLLQSDQRESEEYWKQYFRGFLEQGFPSHPNVYQNYQPRTVATAMRRLRLPDETARNTSLPNSILLSWALTISQYAGSRDVVFGTTLSGRNVPVQGIDAILAPTITTLPFRIQLDNSKTVQETLDIIQSQAVETMSFEHTGLQQMATFGSEVAAACRFRNHLVIQPPETQTPSTLFAHGQSQEIVDNYLISLEVTLPGVDERSLAIVATHDVEIVPPWLMGNILDQLNNNFTEILSKPSEKLQDLTITSRESLETVFSWNRNVPQPVHCCVHDLLGRRCLAQPKEMAVDAFDGTLTYESLDRHATDFAIRLQALGVRSSEYVMVVTERSLWAVVAMLAIMKAGAAFVMVDPATPSARMQQIKDDSMSRIMVTSIKEKTRAQDLGLPGVVIPTWSDASLQLVDWPYENPSVSPDDAVYAVFTSGSTGRPKGIVIQHRSLATAATINGAMFGIDETSRVLNVTSFAFDTSMAEIFYTLVQGGCICIPSEADSRNQLEAAMNHFRVTTACLTPSLARALNPSKLQSLRTLALGGEAVSKVDIGMWANKAQVINGYGPAECTIDSTIQSNVSLENGLSNIGFGAATVTWIVDPNDENCSTLVPLGAVGELVLEGPVLGQGYLNNAAKTASSFIEFPDWLTRMRRGKRGRLYRTGDLVQYSPRGDGSLLYVGRKDNQVKLRGQRIELGDVEGNLIKYLPSAKEAIAEVIRPCDAGAEPALAAFILFNDANQSLTTDDAESEILAHADSEMKFNLRMPKILDRKRLREMVSGISRKELRAYASDDLQRRLPSGEKENVLQNAVSTVLGLSLDDVGMDDSFFKLGGDSITAMRLAGFLKEKSYSLTVADIFRYPRLGELAALSAAECMEPTRTLQPYELLPMDQRSRIIQDAADQCGVAVGMVEDVYPCTPMQEALVALTLKQQKDYVAELTLDLPQSANIDQVKAAWEKVYEANPILRTRIMSSPFASGRSLQAVIREPMEWSCNLDPLIVENGKPLHKAVLFGEPKRQKLAIYLHHALYDGHSLAALLSQAQVAYDGGELFSKSFNTFSAYTSAMDLKSAKEFWCKDFADLDSAMFPAVRSRQSSAQRESTSYTINIPETRNLEFTLANVIQSACAVALGHFTNAQDVVYGLTLAGRNAPVTGIEEIIGPTISTVPFRVLLSPEQTMRSLMCDIQDHLSRMTSFEQVGLQNIRGFSTECASACDFRCHLVIQPAEHETQLETFREPEISNDTYSRFSSSPLFLAFNISADKRSIQLVATFDVSYLEAVEVTGFARHLDSSIQLILQDPSLHVRDLQRAGPCDLVRIEEWNAFEQPALQRLTHDLVAERCLLQPDVEAVCSWDGSLTYGQLEDASSRFAQHLLACGNRANSVTALCMEKSRWAIVAILGILKSGSACGMLDPSYPIERMQEILRQTSAACVVASPATRELTESIVGDSETTIIIAPQSLWQSVPPSPPQTPRPSSPHDAAFMIFTSGSTGKPKGIVLEHKSIATGLRDLCGPLGLNENSRVLHFASYAFDASVLEVLGCLGVGGCICIPSESDRTTNLCEFIEQHRVNWAFMIPSTSQLIEPDKVPSLKTLAMGGEAFKPIDVERWGGNNDLQLLNLYGPAEGTFGCAVGKITLENWTYGWTGPIVNGNCWIVDPSDPECLCAIGAIGELLIEGPILAREYLKDRQKTAESFITSPRWLSRLRGHEDSRLYKTGDLFQYTNNGHLRYVSRKDRQLKLNGQRLEPEEIESRLVSCFADDATIVVDLVRATKSGTRPRLFAFVHLNRSKCLDSREDDSEIPFAKPDDEFLALCLVAKDKLSESLPRYMIPTVFIPLSLVPRTGSGKINRRLISQAAASLEASELGLYSDRPTQQSQPATPAERVMSELWAVILGLPQDNINASDNFFNLGGDSISAMKLVSAARSKGVKLSVSEIFSHPRLSEMAVRATSCQNARDFATIEPFSLLQEDERCLVLETAAHCQVEPELIEDIYPCTPMQEALISQSMRSPGAYLGLFRFRLAKGVDINRLQEAWSRVLGANPILRTRFIQTSSIYQVVLRQDHPWQVVDLMALEGMEHSLKTREMKLGCPLVQIILGQSSEPDIPDEILLVIHHALYDGWSLQLVLSQVQQAYGQIRLQYQPFNRFIDHLKRVEMQDAERFWIEQLSGAGAVTFPMLPEPEIRPRADAVIRQGVKVKSFSDITIASLLEFSWALTLAQYDSSPVSYGIVLSGRSANLAGIESITGPTITTVPANFVLDKEASTVDELHRLQSRRAAASRFEQFGLQRIRRVSSEAEAACLFQNLLLIQQCQVQSSEEFLIPVDARGDAGDFSAYALEVTCEVSEEDCRITFDFDSSILDPRQAKRVLDQFVHTIGQVQKHPEKPLSDIDFLTVSDWEDISLWNKHLPAPVGRCVHEVIQEQCLKTPSAEAVCAWDGNLTYQQLGELSDRLASHLHITGTGPEKFIPILSDKSKWVAVCILGIIKAGGAVVLLDPAIPFERMQIICSSINAHCILSSSGCAKTAKRLAPSVIEIGDKCFPPISKSLGMEPAVRPHNAIYLIFTSGSTGKPKGIVITHDAFHTSGQMQQAPLYLDANTRTLQFASHMFDVCIADYLWTFLAGGCVCVASNEELKNDLTGAINRLKVNRADLTPSIARVLRPDDIPNVKTILLGGEPMSRLDMQMWLGKVRLVNGYGPSECSVCCVLADVESDCEPSNIGYTYGALSWVVDKDDQDILLPIGSVGELVIEGHTLAREYLDELDKTAAAFIKSPRWLRALRPDSRLYKTGDLVQYNPNGTLKYIGRKDTQVKIRGQRVELGEIEHMIRETSSSIRDVVVEVVQQGNNKAAQLLVVFASNLTTDIIDGEIDEAGDRLLFLPATQRHRDESQKMLQTLRNKLPIYMVPDVIIPLSYIPLSANGKADRSLLRNEAAALTRQQISLYQSSTFSKRAPDSEAESLLQHVVCDILKLEPTDVGLDDSFFRLGGDSIIAIRLVERAELQGFNFRVSDVFKHPRLSDLAQFVNNSSTVSGESSSDEMAESCEIIETTDTEEVSKVLSRNGFPCEENGIAEILPVTQAAERYLFQTPEYWIVNLRGPVPLAQLQSACSSLVARHEILRTVFTRDQGRFIQVVLREVDTRVKHLLTDKAISDCVEQYRQKDMMTTPTVNVPITDFVFLQSSCDSEPRQALVVRLSHAQFDGYSLHKLWKDLKDLYEGKTLPPAAKYSSHVQKWSRSRTAEAIDYWKDTLAESSVTKIGNADFSGITLCPSGESKLVTSSRVVKAEEESLGNITMATIVKAAWAVLLTKLSGSEDVVFSQVSNGRNYTSSTVNEVVGICLNFIPVRVRLGMDQKVTELLKSVQTQHYESMAHELLDFRDIARHSTSWPRETNSQSVIVHQNIDPDEVFQFGDAEAWVTCSYEWPHPPDDILIESRPLGDGSLQITMDARGSILCQQNADLVVERLCCLIGTMSGLAEDSETNIGTLLAALDQ
ncbi:hypothetical protein HIM_07899 [Hirsutella minnesotensis 3608]|uniref:Carrier domain-containing protein n=1 Tax=Hirsutella minnesotensis 3608 TaxID=1043627 RepID=A0A0F7ZYM0_9HYPO|nr:hypothetical protein HIM_07899 [Hirsutella minnesotensis 3608]